MACLEKTMERGQVRRTAVVTEARMRTRAWPERQAPLRRQAAVFSRDEACRTSGT
jgi:hypothetical protein